MTLENIFFGKKVVQKAYLNNALIYESKGWQTLPSTCTEVWTKSYEKVGSIGAIVKDEDDNIYIGSGNTVYKVAPDGNLKWKCAVDEVTAIVVYPTYIYCSYLTRTVSDTKGYLAKIDINGNLISTVETDSFLPTSTGIYIVDMQRDDDYIYAITNSYIFKLNSNLGVISYTNVPDTALCLATNNNQYVVVGTINYGVRFVKNDFNKATKLVGSGTSFITKSIAIDSIGNVYLASNQYAGVNKYNIESCKLLTTFTSYQTFALCTDNQENVYVEYRSEANNTYCLKKYSSDGTLIWENVPIPTANNNVKVITDSNGNIYVAYIDSNSMLTIRKLINLVKET